MQRPKVGDRVVVEARVTRVDENGFTFQVDSLTPITVPYDHQALISVGQSSRSRIRPSTGEPQAAT